MFAANFVRKLSIFGLLALVIIAGYGLLMIILNATVRDFTPEENVGLFQGVRMIFFVLIPMVVGPFLGNSVIEAFASKHAAGIYYNDFQEAVMVPVPEIFAAAAILGLLIFLPLILIKKEYFFWNYASLECITKKGSPDLFVVCLTTQNPPTLTLRGT